MPKSPPRTREERSEQNKKRFKQIMKSSRLAGVSEGTVRSYLLKKKRIKQEHIRQSLKEKVIQRQREKLTTNTQTKYAYFMGKNELRNPEVIRELIRSYVMNEIYEAKHYQHNLTYKEMIEQLKEKKYDMPAEMGEYLLEILTHRMYKYDAIALFHRNM